MNLFNPPRTKQLAAFKYGNYLLVPQQKSQFEWYAMIVHFQTKEQLHKYYDTTKKGVIENGILYIKENLPIDQSFKDDVKKYLEANNYNMTPKQEPNINIQMLNDSMTESISSNEGVSNA